MEKVEQKKAEVAVQERLFDVVPDTCGQQHAVCKDWVEVVDNNGKKRKIKTTVFYGYAVVSYDEFGAPVGFCVMMPDGEQRTRWTDESLRANKDALYVQALHFGALLKERVICRETSLIYGYTHKDNVASKKREVKVGSHQYGECIIDGEPYERWGATVEETIINCENTIKLLRK
jgi:hypothetical protein